MKDAARIMRSLVNHHGLSLEEVADAIDVSEQSTRHWYTSNRKPKLTLLIRLQRFHDQVLAVGVQRAFKNVKGCEGRTQDVSALVELVNEMPLNQRIFLVISVLTDIEESIAGKRGS